MLNVALSFAREITGDLAVEEQRVRVHRIIHVNGYELAIQRLDLDHDEHLVGWILQIRLLSPESGVLVDRVTVDVQVEAASSVANLCRLHPVVRLHSSLYQPGD